MNKFMRLFAVLLVVAAVVLIVVSLKLGGNHAQSAKHVAGQSHAARAGSTSTPDHTTYAVVTAAARLEPGEPVTADELRVVQESRPVTHGYQSVDDVVGKVPAIAIAEGVALTRDLILDDLSTRLKPGERALAVPVTEVAGVGYRIHPGDYVDVFFSLKHKDGSSRNNGETTQSRLLLPRLRVLAYGPRDLPAVPEPAAAGSSGKNGKARLEASNNRINTAVLAVPLGKVNHLLLVQASQNKGRLTLALRNPHDRDMPDPSLFAQPGPVLKTMANAGKDEATKKKLASAVNHAYAGISLDGLAEGKNGTTHRTVHTVQRARGHRVDVIRGSQRSHITVSQ